MLLKAPLSAVLTLLTFGALGAVPAFRPTAPRHIAVGVGPSVQVPKGVRAAVSAPGGNLTVVRDQVITNADGSQIIKLLYTNAAGQLVSTRTLFIDSGCSKVIDNLTNVVSSSGPTAECSGAATQMGVVDSTLSSAAAGGKLNL